MSHKSWSKEAECAADNIYQQILELPFVKKLADGSLPEEKFLFYLKQDSLYLREYSRVMSHAASRMPQSWMTAEFLRFASDGIAVENALHESFLKNNRPLKSEMSPECMLYTSWHLGHTLSPVEVEAAALLPCFTIYAKVGETIAQNSSDGNRYARWIDTYSDPSFLDSAEKACEVCDALAENANPETREAMTETFITASKMEWLFWDSAWAMRTWPI